MAELIERLFVNVSVENLAPCKKLLRVELEAAKVDEAFDTVTKDFQKNAALPGFRPGKAPKDMVAKRFEIQIQQEVKNKLTREGYQSAIKDQKLRVVSVSDIEEVQFAKGEPFHFVATIETAPDFTLPEYKGLPAKREKAQVSDADVDRAVMLLRERQTKYEVVAREVREGDVAVVNYKGTCEGKSITELAPAARGVTEQKNFWVQIDKGSFIPGFADQLIGAKAGDKRTVNVDFPADFVTPQLQGKKGTYEVEIVEVREKSLPELNDDFAKTYDLENVQKLRDAVRVDLEKDLKVKVENAVRDQIVRGLLEQVQTELPESYVQQETRNVVYNIVNENQQRGVPSENIQAEKEKIYASASLAAKERVKATFLFQKIAEKEGIKVEQQEMLQQLQRMAASYQMPVDKLIKDIQKRDGFGEIHEQILNQKVVQFLVDNAKIEEVEPQAKA